jgi:hypothetical protein
MFIFELEGNEGAINSPTPGIVGTAKVNTKKILKKKIIIK